MTNMEKGYWLSVAKKRQANLDRKHQVTKAKKAIYELLGFALIGLMIFTVLMVNAWING